MGNFLKSFWSWLNKPSSYEIWDEAFKRLQLERKAHGLSQEYWRIWDDEVCPAYRKLSIQNANIFKESGGNK